MRPTAHRTFRIVLLLRSGSKRHGQLYDGSRPNSIFGARTPPELPRYNPPVRKWAITSALLLWCGTLLVAGDDIALREHLNDHKFADGWIYEDIDAGYKQATESGKPLLVCFCCVP
jgi:hypothetical protein